MSSCAAHGPTPDRRDARTYENTLHCIKQTFREGGVRVFFSGTLLNLIRAFPVSAVILPASEIIRRKADGVLPPPDANG